MEHLINDLCQVLLNAVFPLQCLVCGAPHVCPSSLEECDPGRASDSPDTWFCPSCRKGFTPVASPLCTRCGLPFVSRQGEDHTCSACLTERRYFRRARAFGLYEGDLMEAVHLLKYGKKTALARPLGALVRETFFRFWDTDGIDLFIPVPLHMKRLRERGFNQACLLVKRWAKQEGIPVDALNLRRHRLTQPQTALNRADRQRNVRGTFSLRHPERIQGKKVLLVDDVYTTGATVNECARVLMDSGAAVVDVLTLARTP